MFVIAQDYSHMTANNLIKNKVYTKEKRKALIRLASVYLSKELFLEIRKTRAITRSTLTQLWAMGKFDQSGLAMLRNQRTRRGTLAQP